MRRATAGGYTFVEMMATMAVAAILLAAAVPSLRPLFVRSAVASQVNGLISAMRYARSEAVTRGAPVRMCRIASPGATGCGGGSSEWRHGWIVVAEDGTLLRRTDASGARLGIESIESLGELAWAASGDLVTRPGGDGIMRFRIGSDATSEAGLTRLVCVSMNGRPRVARPEVGCAGG